MRLLSIIYWIFIWHLNACPKDGVCNTSSDDADTCEQVTRRNHRPVRTTAQTQASVKLPAPANSASTTKDDKITLPSPYEGYTTRPIPGTGGVGYFLISPEHSDSDDLDSLKLQKSGMFHLPSLFHNTPQIASFMHDAAGDTYRRAYKAPSTKKEYKTDQLPTYREPHLTDCPPAFSAQSLHSQQEIGWGVSEGTKAAVSHTPNTKTAQQLTTLLGQDRYSARQRQEQLLDNYADILALETTQPTFTRCIKAYREMDYNTLQATLRAIGKTPEVMIESFCGDPLKTLEAMKKFVQMDSKHFCSLTFRMSTLYNSNSALYNKIKVLSGDVLVAMAALSSAEWTYFRFHDGLSSRKQSNAWLRYIKSIPSKITRKLKWQKFGRKCKSGFKTAFRYGIAYPIIGIGIVLSAPVGAVLGAVGSTIVLAVSGTIVLVVTCNPLVIFPVASGIAKCTVTGAVIAPALLIKLLN